MKVQAHIGRLFSGVFLANWIPHFVHGVDGERFPTPFSIAFGPAFSAPIFNVIWAGFNLAFGYGLWRVSKVCINRAASVATVLMGFVTFGALLALAAPIVLTRFK